MRAHHERVIERLVERYHDDERFPALIVGGSIVKGWARDDSDVDVIFVATDNEFARRQATHEYCIFDRELCDYPGGYVDGKVIDQRFLSDVAERGSETARAAFVGAFLAYSRIPGLEETLKRIPVYPEHEQEARMKAFYSNILLLRWFIGEAEKRHDIYLLTHTAADLVLFGARLILAYNKILFPYHKWLMTVVREAEQKPAELVPLAEQLLREPNGTNAQHFVDCISNFRDWGVPFNEAVSRFIEINEWNWRTGRPAVEDW